MSGEALPHRLVAFYGDDFTGSTDTMEVAALAGLDPVLFVATPDESMIAAFPDARVVGIAGISRSQDPDWMDANLPAAFEALRSVGAPFVHYKVCSTFDSAPHVGSIGRAAEIGRRVFGTGTVPVLVGAPALRRYVAFGNLFAGFRDAAYRIDRHPVMSRHPVTPMREADLRLHLGQQTALTVALADLDRLDALDPAGDWREGFRDADLLLFDTVDERTLERAGLLAWSMRAADPVFAVGSSGFEYALVAAWRRLGLLPPTPPPPAIRPVERLFVVSGSCSPMTAIQIENALAAGFVGIEIDPLEVVDGSLTAEALAERCLGELEKGRDVLLGTARGPETVVAQPGTMSASAFNDRLGAALGRVLRQVLERGGLKRAVVSGGDTSSHAVGQLGLEALRFAGPLAPGVPLCRTFGRNRALDGLELALKGGQLGGEDFFVRAKNGHG